MAFSTLDTLMSYDRKHQWLTFLCNSGFLNHWITEVKTKEDTLIALLNPAPESLRPLYVYESKLAFLTELAQSAKGSIVVLEMGLIRQLMLSQFIDQRPEDAAILGNINIHTYNS